MMYLKISRRRFHLLHVVPLAALAFLLSASGQTHYPGITPQQDSLAFIAIECVGNHDWEHASLTLARMTDIEEESDLAPLSYLLMISTYVLRVQNDEFDSLALKKRALSEIDRLYKDGIALTERKIYPDSAHATLLFIEGGIRGYRANARHRIQPRQRAQPGRQSAEMPGLGPCFGPFHKRRLFGFRAF